MTQLDWESLFDKVSQVSSDTGVAAYLVGGFIRDLLLHRTQKDEADMMVLGDGPAFAEVLTKALGKGATLTTFKNFGTAQIKWRGMIAEFVGARKESYRAESRKPDVEQGTLEDDLSRRDFTINALAVDLANRQAFEIIDLFGGLEDLSVGKLRTPLDPDITFSDDPLRMMRAARFASQLNFEIVPEALEAMTRNAERIRIVSVERVMDEFNKILLSPQPSIGLKILFQTSLLKEILPELTALQGVHTIGNQSHKDNFFHTLQVLDNICPNTDNLYLRWAALMHDIGKAPTQRFDKEVGWTFHGHEVVGARMVPKIFKRLKLPQDDRMKYVQKLVLLHLRPIALTQEVTDSAVRRLIVDADPDLDDLMTLCVADITSKNLAKKTRYTQRFEEVKLKVAEVEEKDQLRNWKPPITGDIIMTTFDIPPSRKVGDIKDAVREAILDGIIPNEYHAAHAYMLDIAAKHNLFPKRGVS